MTYEGEHRSSTPCLDGRINWDQLLEETHELWNENSLSEWIAYGKRVQETETAVFFAYCCEEHAARCEEAEDHISEPWETKHGAKEFFTLEEGLKRTKEIGAVASYREIILRQRNHSRDEVKR